MMEEEVRRKKAEEEGGRRIKEMEGRRKEWAFA